MHLVCKIIFSLWIFAVAVNSEIKEANSEIVNYEGLPIYATYNTCGGYVEAKLDQIVVIEYKPDEEYDNDEFCVWEIRNGECFDCLITKRKSGFEVGYDYLQISDYYFTYLPAAHKYILGNTTGIEQVNMDGHFNFVVFTTDYSNTGTGFRLEIVGYTTKTSKAYEDFITDSPIGSITLRPYPHNTLQSYLIVPKLKTVPSLVLDIEYVLESVYDDLAVYSMERNGQSINFRTHAGELTRNGTASFRTNYYTNFIIFFNSNSNGIPANGGFELKWYVPDSPTTKIDE